VVEVSGCGFFCVPWFFFKVSQTPKTLRGSLFFLFSKVKEVVCVLFITKIVEHYSKKNYNYNIKIDLSHIYFLSRFSESPYQNAQFKKSAKRAFARKMLDVY
jgi:hypothetical protein